MATSSRLVFIGAGTPTVVSSTVTLLDSGTAGTLGALRTLVHPDGTNFSPITYYLNPSRSINVDAEVLPHVIGSAPLTLTGRKTVRFQLATTDVVVTEIWEGAEGRRASMPYFLWRQLLEYLLNPPAFDAVAQTYIQWSPRDVSARTYNVEIIDLRVGGNTSGDDAFDINPWRANSGPIRNPLESMDVSPTALLDRDVRLRMKIVGEVV